MLQLLGKFFKLLITVYVFVMAYQLYRPFPDALSAPSSSRNLSDTDVSFLADVTYLDEHNVRITDQKIWNEIFRTIDNAEHFVLLDMFLFNDFQGANPETTRKLSSELTDRLVAIMAAHPEMTVVLVTDPINSMYGGYRPEQIDRLVAGGVHVVYTDLGVLRDSNLLWGAAYRPFFSWMGNKTGGGYFPNPFQANGQKVTLRTWATLLNFKANHRKILVADAPPQLPSDKAEGRRSMITIVTSSNPHDGSSAHGNVALRINGGIWGDAVGAEAALIKISGADIPNYALPEIVEPNGDVAVTLLREEWIRRRALELINAMVADDKLDFAMFYLSDRRIVKAIVEAAKRGVHIRLILDPNKDAFGWEKNGVPNRPVAKELMKSSGGDIEIRWCDTHGEQCHAKLMMGKTASTSFMMLGSANFTRRNIGGFNLEENVLAESPKEFTAWKDAQKYFDALWTNEGKRIYTVDYNAYRDDTFWKTSLYRMMERTGLSSF